MYYDILQVRNTAFYEKQPIDQMVVMSQLNPTITFIIPIRGRHEFLVEEINAIFRFSEHYGGFCELVIVADGASSVSDATLKIAGIAIKLNRANHQHVRAKVIRCTSSLGFRSLIEMSMNHALGQKLIIVTNDDAGNTDLSQIRGLDLLGRDILIAEYLISETMLDELLHK